MKALGKLFYSRLIYSLSLLTILILNLSLPQTQEWLIYNISNTSIPKDILVVSIDGQNNKWIGTNGKGLLKFDGKNLAIFDTSNSGLPNNYIYEIAIDGQGNKWIGTYGGGLAKFDGVNWTVYNTSNSGLPNNYVRAIAIDGQGNKWIGTNGGGLAKFDGVNLTVYNTSNSGLPSNAVLAIAIDGQGNKWIGTDQGLAKFDGANWTVYNTSNTGLASNYISAIAVDGQGNIWIGADCNYCYPHYYYLAKFDGVKWTTYATPFNYPRFRRVRTITIDKSGRVWIGTEPYATSPGSGYFDGGLFVFNGTNWTVYDFFNSGLGSSSVRDIAIDKQGNLWIATGPFENGWRTFNVGGLVKFDGVNWTIYNDSTMGGLSNNVVAIAIDEGGNKWIGTGWGGLVKFDGVNLTVYNTSNSGLPSNLVRAIAIDKQGNKWIGTGPYWNGSAWVGGGLAKFDGVNWTVYNTSNSGLPDDDVYAIAIDGVGNKWIGTGWGLAKFDGVNWTVYKTSNSGLPDDYVWAIAIDDSGNIWIGPYYGGLVKFDGIKWTVYNTSNSGLPDNTVTAIAIDGQGNKWIGTDGRGAAKFDGVNWTVYNTSNSGLPDNRVNAIAIDGQGNKWIGTEGGGLAKFDGVNWTVYNTSNSRLPSNDVEAVFSDEAGNKWIGTWGGGLAVYREGGVIPLYVSASKLNFGKVYVSKSSLSLKLKIINLNSSAISLNGVSFNYPSVFKVLNTFPINLAPKDSVFLDFVFSPLSSRIYKDTARISSNVGEVKIYLESIGLRPPYLSSVDSFNFGSVFLADSLSKYLYVKNTGEVDTVKISKVEVNSPFYIKGVSKMVLPPGDSTRIDLVLRGEVDGLQGSTLRVISNAWNDTLKIYLYGNVLPFVATSSKLNFGNLYISDSLELKLRIRNVATSTINLNSISFSRGVAFKVRNTFPIVLFPGDSVILGFVFKPLSSGLYKDTAVISTKVGEIMIYLEGRGVRPPYLSSVDSINFGSVFFGDSLSRSLWVKNTGDIDTVKISKVEVNTPFYVRSISKYVLRPADSTRIDLVFRGEIDGLQSSSLKVISNAWNDTLKIYLYGNVLPFIVSTKQLNFGRVYISDSLRLKINVKNGSTSTKSLNGVSFVLGGIFRILNKFPINLASNDSVLLDFVFKPLSSVEYKDTATISTSSGSFKIYLEGRGTRPPYLSSVDSVNFGMISFGDSLSKSLWLTNTGEIDTVRIIKIEVGAPFYVRGISKMVLPPGDNSKIDFVLKGDSLGFYGSVARVISNAWNDTIKISLYGIISISQLKFGNVYISNSLNFKLKLKNARSSFVNISGVSFSRGLAFSVKNTFPIVLSSGDSVSLDFVFKPLSSVVYKDTATISTSSGSFKIYLEGRGIRPPYLSSVDSVNFGTVALGDSLSKSLWVKNTGEIDTVRISKVEVEVPFYVRGVSKFVLPPGDSSRIDLVLRGDSLGSYNSILKVISNAWNDTLKIYLYGSPKLFKQFTSFRQVQSGVVKFVYQVQTTSTFDLKKFEYSTDGVNWVESKNISGSTTITGTKTDTIYWDSKKDLPNFESLNVKVRFTFTGGGFDFPVVLNVGVDNKPPSFTGVKGHSFLGFNSVKLLFNRGVDISKFDYIVSFVDTVDRVYRSYRTSLDSVVLGGFYSVAGYVFYVRCVDEFGNVGDSLRYDVKFPVVGDYNFDGKIDAYDLGVFVLGWTNRDSVCDFYPFEGRVPVVRVVGDKKLDAGDVWVFTMFWDRGKRGGFGKVSELSVESFGNERGMNLRYSGGYVTIGFDDFDVSGRFVSGGVEIVYDRGSFRFDSLLFDFDGLKLSYVDSSGGVFYLDFGRGGGFDFEKLGARVRFKVLKEVKEGMIVKLKLYDEGLKLFERSYRISFEEVPTEYALYQNYPNPFNPTTTIEFDIPEKTNVKLVIYDILGREIETLIDKELEPGKYKLNFTATNLPSGVYFYLIRAGNFVKVKKMTLIK
jgi:ligand-binding sensor domain-containing protein